MKNFAALLTALAGLVFCVLAALGLADDFCAGEGCRLFRGMTLLGIDLYWFGAVYFAIAAVLIVGQGRRGARERRRPAVILRLWLLAGLVIDGLLLGVQALTAPCPSCLIVAALLGLTALLLLGGSRLLAAVLLLWSVLLVAAAGGLLRQQVGPVAVYGDEQATVRLFFSPSCPSCLHELRELAGREDLHPRLALYPLALNDGDLPVIYRFRAEVAAGAPLAAAVAKLNSAAPALSGWRQGLDLRLLSLRNRAFLATIGARTIPYLLTSTPGRLLPPASSAVPGGQALSPVSPLTVPLDEGCEYDQRQVECKEEAPPPLLNLDALRP